MNTIKRILATAFLVGVVAPQLFSEEAQAVGTRRIALRSGDDFASGKLEGVAVDSTGRVRAGLQLGKLPVADATSVWSMLDIGQGRRLIATGNEGKLLELADGKVRQVAKADALVLTSLVQAWKGAILVASMPQGKLYEYKDGKLTEWLALPETKHIFQLAFDAKAQVLYAATGPEGKLYRITADKKAQVYFDAPEQHLASVAVGASSVYAGAGDKAKLYEVTAPGRASVVHDFGTTEVRAIAVTPSGDVYAIANEIKGQKIPPEAAAQTKGSGVLFRFEGGKIPELLLDNNSEYFSSLGLDAKGRPYVGTGVEGKVYTVDENRNSVLVADVDERQVSAVWLAGNDPLIVASDPIVIHPVRADGADVPTWTSKVMDAGIRSHFGRLGWVADGALSLETRSGNAAEPDDTWSSWSASLTAPGDITSPAARFFQVRARWTADKQAVLREVVVPFRSDNLRAVITNIDAESAASKAMAGPDGKLLASGGPVSSKPDDEIELSWGIDNPDKDELRYRLDYRLADSPTWYSLLEPHEKLTKTSYTWNTRDLPEGKYRVRVTVTDELSNPPDLVKRHVLESHVISVDNTPPRFEALQVVGRSVKVALIDGVGPIIRLEAAVAGTDDWVPFAPDDGIFDETREQFELDLSSISGTGPAIVVLRAFDQQNNQAVQNVTLR